MSCVAKILHVNFACNLRVKTLVLLTPLYHLQKSVNTALTKTLTQTINVTISSAQMLMTV